MDKPRNPGEALAWIVMWGIVVATFLIAVGGMVWLGFWINGWSH